MPGPRLPSHHGCADSPGLIQEQQDTEEDQEKTQTPLLDRGLPGRTKIITPFSAGKSSLVTNSISKHVYFDILTLLWCCGGTFQGAKLFYLSGMVYGEYQTQEVKNLGRFISVMKFRPLVWQTSHPYVLADRWVITPAWIPPPQTDFTNFTKTSL